MQVFVTSLRWAVGRGLLPDGVEPNGSAVHVVAGPGAQDDDAKAAR